MYALDTLPWHPQDRGALSRARVPDLFEQIPCRSLEDASVVLSGPAYARRASLEHMIAVQHRRHETFSVPGICGVDGAPVSFLVDRQWGARRLDDGTWLPNWRERLECPSCGLNNRQRALASVVFEDIDRRRTSGSCRVWLMEQLTATSRIFGRRLTPDELSTSEYVGHEHASGTVVRGVRHEDAEQTSFHDGSLDVIVSHDVFEHVPHPDRAFREAARILKPGGALYFTIPFYSNRRESVARAVVHDGRVDHRLPAEYHGDPFSGGRSLVFTDFGWDVIDRVRAQGFDDCAAVLYWSLEYGHLGVGSFWFVARR